MKKLVLTVILLAFVSAIPSFAMKVITNKELDRTVPSRSSRPGTEMQLGSYQETTYTIPKNRAGYRDGWGYQGVTYEKYYKPLISRDIRFELVGTHWDYPKATNYQLEKVTKTYNTAYKNLYGKRYMREAADYYVVDTINHPNNAVQAGYDERI